MKKNIRTTLEYDGSRYDGWQKQGNTDNTIQGKLEAVLFKWTGQEVEPFSGVCSRRRRAGSAETGHMRPAGQSLRSLRKENCYGNTRGTVQQDHC